MPFHTLHVPAMSCQNALEATLGERPYSNTRVVTGGGETLVVWAEADSTNGFFRLRALPCCEVVHVGFEVFDHTTLVRRREVGSGMVEAHCANRVIVCLQDGFEVERKAIPQCKLATGRASENTTRLWCPLQTVNSNSTRNMKARTVTTLTGHRILLVDV